MKYENLKTYPDTKFRRICGVKRSTFNKMVEIFQKAYAEKPKRRRGKSKVFIVALSDSILAEFGGISLIDHYDVYEALMNYWDEAMQDDVCHQF